MSKKKRRRRERTYLIGIDHVGCTFAHRSYIEEFFVHTMGRSDTFIRCGIAHNEGVTAHAHVSDKTHAKLRLSLSSLRAQLLLL